MVEMPEVFQDVRVLTLLAQLGEADVSDLAGARQSATPQDPQEALNALNADSGHLAAFEPGSPWSRGCESWRRRCSVSLVRWYAGLCRVLLAAAAVVRLEGKRGRHGPGGEACEAPNARCRQLAAFLSWGHPGYADTNLGGESQRAALFGQLSEAVKGKPSTAFPTPPQPQG